MKTNLLKIVITVDLVVLGILADDYDFDNVVVYTVAAALRSILQISEASCSRGLLCLHFESLLDK